MNDNPASQTITYYVSPQSLNIWRRISFLEYIKLEAEGGWDFVVVAPPGVLPDKWTVDENGKTVQWYEVDLDEW